MCHRSSQEKPVEPPDKINSLELHVMKDHSLRFPVCLSVFSPFSRGTLSLSFCQILELVLVTVLGVLMVLPHCRI